MLSFATGEKPIRDSRDDAILKHPNGRYSVNVVSLISLYNPGLGSLITEILIFFH